MSFSHLNSTGGFEIDFQAAFLFSLILINSAV